MLKLKREGGALALVSVVWMLAWCGDVVAAWRHSPYDRFGWIAAAGWIVWVAVTGRREAKTSWPWLASAWVVWFVGVAGELNVVQHAGAALAGATWAGGGRRGLITLLLALGWVPALGWALRGAGAETVLALRLATGAAGLVLAWREGRRA